MTLRPEAGSRWRLLVHDQDPNKPGHYLTAHHVQPVEPPGCVLDSEHSRAHVIPGAVFDELVAGSWLHVEDMGPVDGTLDDDLNPVSDGSSTWWMNIAGATLWVTVNPDGRPTNLTYYPPGSYDTAVDGCTYHEYGEDLP